MKIRNNGALIVGLLVTACIGSYRAEAQQANFPAAVIRWADTVVYNGKILTADKNFSVVQAVAIRDGKFLAVGRNEEALALAGPNTRRIDLQGKTATAGLLDLHNDSFGGAQIRHWNKKWVGNEPEWKSKGEALEGIKRIVAKAKPGEPVMIPRMGFERSGVGDRSGSFCDPNTFRREEIDAITPNNPVFFITAVNATPQAENSRAAEVTKRFLPKGVTTPYTKEGGICIVTGLGDVDGILPAGSQAANDYVVWVEPPDVLLDSYRENQQRLNAAGLVLVKGHMLPPTFNGVRQLWEQGELTIRFRMPFPMIPQTSGHTVELPMEEAEMMFRRWPNMSHIGDNMLRVVGIRVPAVGGNVTGGDSWMLEPKARVYRDRWGNESPYGGRIQEQAAVERGDRNTFRGREVLIQATRFGWNVSADHTIGDRAFREVISAFEEGLKDMVVKRSSQRLTTNHTPMANEADIEKAAKLGVWSSVSTGHVMSNRELESGLFAFGTERVNKMAPIKSYIKQGMRPSLEGTMWNWDTAFFWIGKGITRKDNTYKKVWNAPEALTRQEALWATTLWAAQQLAEDKDLGSVEPGKEADLVIMDKDYMTVPPDEIETIRSLLTMVGGKIVFEKQGAL